MIKSISSFDIKNKRILIRADMNVPLKNGLVEDNFRIKSSLPTIKYCINNGAKIILMSHLGRPKGVVNDKMSLMPVGEILADLLEMPIKFSHDCVSEDAHDVTLGLKSGEIHLLENLRFSDDEIKNDKDFSFALAKHGDIFINDAFGTAHRAHASNVGIAKHFTHKGIGFLLEKELEYFNSLVRKPKKPFVVVLGGAKIDTKLALIDRFLNIADKIMIGGGMAFTLMKAQGKNIGNSICDDSLLQKAEHILEKSKNANKLILPSDFVCNHSLNDKSEPVEFDNKKIDKDFMGLDIGLQTIKRFNDILSNAKTILWNGPMGVFEDKRYENGTMAIAKHIADLTEKGIISIVGGGDSASALRKYDIREKITHLSTGGGASLELLSGNPLPATYVLEL